MYLLREAINNAFLRPTRGHSENDKVKSIFGAAAIASLRQRMDSIVRLLNSDCMVEVKSSKQSL